MRARPAPLGNQARYPRHLRTLRLRRMRLHVEASSLFSRRRPISSSSRSNCTPSRDPPCGRSRLLSASVHESHRCEYMKTCAPKLRGEHALQFAFTSATLFPTASRSARAAARHDPETLRTTSIAIRQTQIARRRSRNPPTRRSSRRWPGRRALPRRRYPCSGTFARFRPTSRASSLALRAR